MVTGTVCFSSARICGQRHQLFAGVLERADIGVDRHEEVLAAGLDAVAGIVDDRDVGSLGILDEAFEVAAQLAGIAVVGDVGLEAEAVEHLLDGACVVFGIGQLRDVLVVGLADDQRDAAQLLAVFGMSEPGKGNEPKSETCAQQHIPRPNPARQRRRHCQPREPKPADSTTQGNGRIMAHRSDGREPGTVYFLAPEKSNARTVRARGKK